MPAIPIRPSTTMAMSAFSRPDRLWDIAERLLLIGRSAIPDLAGQRVDAAGGAYIDRLKDPRDVVERDRDRETGPP